jgi:hypothetical protein
VRFCISLLKRDMTQNSLIFYFLSLFRRDGFITEIRYFVEIKAVYSGSRVLISYRNSFKEWMKDKTCKIVDSCLEIKNPYIYKASKKPLD